ncbi:uncharacterized protein J3R85_017803 [Psidium guajava]|nr:uncharacterized protein J3R85_017803 [Psidium guajava]
MAAMGAYQLRRKMKPTTKTTKRVGWVGLAWHGRPTMVGLNAETRSSSAATAGGGVEIERKWVQWEE